MYQIRDEEFKKLEQLVKTIKHKIKERRGLEAYYDMNKINDVLLNAKYLA